MHADEMDLKLRKGAARLDDVFEEAGVTELVDPTRPSVVKRRFSRR
jgi:hypothetical protein